MRARHQRKNLRPHLQNKNGRPRLNSASVLWQPQLLNWWIGSLFALGSLLFIAGSIFTLAPLTLSSAVQDSVLANLVFFVGSLPFSAAAYLQLYQSANSREFRFSELGITKPVYIGWHPGNIGWLSSIIQFGGTLLFNINTLDALLPNIDWLQQDLLVWTPDILGSSLFLISGYLSFYENSQTGWKWEPREIAWQITIVNLLGCITFMVAACLAISLPDSSATTLAAFSTLFTLLGAVAFLVGSLCSLIEAQHSKEVIDECPKT